MKESVRERVRARLERFTVTAAGIGGYLDEQIGMLRWSTVDRQWFIARRKSILSWFNSRVIRLIVSVDKSADALDPTVRKSEGQVVHYLV